MPCILSKAGMPNFDWLQGLVSGERGGRGPGISGDNWNHGRDSRHGRVPASHWSADDQAASDWPVSDTLSSQFFLSRLNI